MLDPTIIKPGSVVSWQYQLQHDSSFYATFDHRAEYKLLTYHDEIMVLCGGTGSAPYQQVFYEFMTCTNRFVRVAPGEATTMNLVCG